MRERKLVRLSEVEKKKGLESLLIDIEPLSVGRNFLKKVRGFWGVKELSDELDLPFQHLREIWPFDYADQDWGPILKPNNIEDTKQYFVDLDRVIKTLQELPLEVLAILKNPARDDNLWEQACQLLNAKGNEKGSIFNSLKDGSGRRIRKVEVEVPPLKDRLKELNLSEDDPAVQLAVAIFDLMFAQQAYYKLVINAREILDELPQQQLKFLANHPLFSETAELREILGKIDKWLKETIRSLRGDGVFEEMIEQRGQNVEQKMRQVQGVLERIEENQPYFLKVEGVLERNYRGWIDGLVSPSEFVARELGVTRSALYSRRWRLKKRVKTLLEKIDDPNFRVLLGDKKILEEAYKVLRTKNFGGKQSRAKEVASFLRDWFLIVESSLIFRKEIKNRGKTPNYLVEFGKVPIEEESIGARALWEREQISSVKSELLAFREDVPGSLTKEWDDYLNSLPRSFSPALSLEYLKLKVSVSDLVSSTFRGTKSGFKRVFRKLRKERVPIRNSVILFELLMKKIKEKKF